MPFSTADWLNLAPLDPITGAPVVGQQMWWLVLCASDTEFRMHIVTVTSSSENGSVITFDSGEVLELITEHFQAHITIHNDIVAKARGEANLTDVDMAHAAAGEGGADSSHGNASPSGVPENNHS